LNKNIIGIVIGVIILGIAIVLITTGIASNNENMPVNEIETNEQNSTEELASEGKKFTVSLQDGITASSP
jgi:hypothetical protein